MKVDFLLKPGVIALQIVASGRSAILLRDLASSSHVRVAGILLRVDLRVLVITTLSHVAHKSATRNVVSSVRSSEILLLFGR